MLSADNVVADDAQILQAVGKIRKEHDRDRERAPEIAPREWNTGDRKEQAIENVSLVHARRKGKERQGRDRAAFEQRLIGAVLQVAPDDQREGREHEHDAPDVLRQQQDVLIVGNPERAAQRPEIKRVDAVVGVDVRTILNRGWGASQAQQTDCSDGMVRRAAAQAELRRRSRLHWQRRERGAVAGSTKAKAIISGSSTAA